MGGERREGRTMRRGEEGTMRRGRRGGVDVTLIEGTTRYYHINVAIALMVLSSGGITFILVDNEASPRGAVAVAVAVLLLIIDLPINNASVLSDAPYW